MRFVPASLARRSATLLIAIGIVACDSGRGVEMPTAPAASAAAAPATPKFDATGVGTSLASVSSVNVTDHSFEQGTGWALNNVDVVRGGWQASDGIASVDLNAFSPGSVSQTIATIPGVTYTVAFDLAGNPGNPQGTKTMTVSAAGSSANYSFSTVGKSTSNMGWIPETFGFTATGTTTTLTFTSTYRGNGVFPDLAQGAALDNVRVTFVPTATTTTVTFGPGPFVYTGGAFTATASASPAEAGTPTITYSGDCTNPGTTCTATATLAANGQYAASTANASITIDKIATTTSVSFGDGPFVYNGTAFTATAASTSPSAAGTPTVTYTGDCTNAGSTCKATATFAGSDTYAASSGSATIVIDKAPTTTTVAFGSSSAVYTGSAFSATSSVSPSAAGSATITYSGDCTNAGSTCGAVATFAGSDNFLPSHSASASLTIDKAPTTTTVSFGPGPFIYTGNAFTATASVNPAAAGSAAITYAGECTFAGTCTATATLAGSNNFLPSHATASIVIKYPVVATGDQCKNGGWRYLTDDLGNLFKNQGDCVSYVATKGRNKGNG